MAEPSPSSSPPLTDIPAELTPVAAYVTHMAQVIDLPLQPEHFPGVVANFARIQAIASLFLEFPLPEDIEVAPVFQP